MLNNLRIHADAWYRTRRYNREEFRYMESVSLIGLSNALGDYYNDVRFLILCAKEEGLKVGSYTSYSLGLEKRLSQLEPLSVRLDRAMRISDDLFED
ncbi:MAG: hypothetical protein Q8R18_01455 [bacterium]|nr:hypothetical protein [bacterium]